MFIPYKKNKGYKVPIIFEFGQQNIRVGYAGADAPELILPSEYLLDSEGSMKFIDYYSTSQPPSYEVRSLVHQGQIVDLDVWKEFLDRIITQHLHQEKGFPFFLIEGAHVKKELRNKMIETLFEEVEVSSVFFHRNTLLAQYLIGRENILVVDCGAHSTTVTPIIDGNIIEKAIIRGEIGGEFITQKLYDCWKHQNVRFSRYKNYDLLSPSLQLFGDLEIVREAKHQICKYYDNPIETLKFNPTVDNVVYELPDNQKLEVSLESYKYPELLFEPTETFEGLDRVIELSLEKIDQDCRKELVQNVTVIGGSSCITNFTERIQRTINALKLPGVSTRSKVQTLQKSFDRQHGSWIGGSIVASAQIYDQWTLTRADYDEHGSALIEKKMFY